MLCKAEDGVQPLYIFTLVRMHPAADAFPARQKHAALNLQIQPERHSQPDEFPVGWNCIPGERHQARFMMLPPQALMYHKIRMINYPRRFA